MRRPFQQRDWQREHRRLGLCTQCSEPATRGTLCEESLFDLQPEVLAPCRRKRNDAGESAGSGASSAPGCSTSSRSESSALSLEDVRYKHQLANALIRQLRAEEFALEVLELGPNDALPLDGVVVVEQRCRICRCSDRDGCVGACAWVNKSLCSSCSRRPPRWRVVLRFVPKRGDGARRRRAFIVEARTALEAEKRARRRVKAKPGASSWQLFQVDCLGLEREVLA